jgi:hypothetical protein
MYWINKCFIQSFHFYRHNFLFILWCLIRGFVQLSQSANIYKIYTRFDSQAQSGKVSDGNLKQNVFVHFTCISKVYRSVRRKLFSQCEKQKVSISALIESGVRGHNPLLSKPNLWFNTKYSVWNQILNFFSKVYYAHFVFLSNVSNRVYIESSRCSVHFASACYTS